MLSSFLVRFFLSLAGALPAIAAAGTDERGFVAVLAEHARRHPGLEVQDAYKLAVHATLGAEHAAPSEETALAWLEKEAATLGEVVGEPLVERIAPDGSLVRVHLRPFFAHGGDKKKLARAFAATGRRRFGTRDDLARRWAAVTEAATAGELPFAADAARAWGERMAAAGWPAVHHSDNFKERFRPAYRVIAGALLSELLPPVQ